MAAVLLLSVEVKDSMELQLIRCPVQHPIICLLHHRIRCSLLHLIWYLWQQQQHLSNSLHRLMQKLKPKLALRFGIWKRLAYAITFSWQTCFRSMMQTATTACLRTSCTICCLNLMQMWRQAQCNIYYSFYLLHKLRIL
jgi:hypothetical protein